jgi:ABC-type branched-subunit amino acid transport system permease subunit
MRRAIDVVLITLILGAVGFGAYTLGHRVDRTSNEAAARDSELNQTTTSATAVGHPAKKARRVTPLFVGVALAGAVGALVLASLLNTVLRTGRRERWRA